MASLTEFVLEAKVTVAMPLEHGTTPYGRRRVIHITGGTFAGPKLRGTVVPGGADWQMIRPDRVTELMAVYDLKTDDGTFIHVTNRGLRHGPDEVMQRLAYGETVDPAEYDWLNRALFIAAAARYAVEVQMRVFQVV
jgi:hypothetical protein